MKQSKLITILLIMLVIGGWVLAFNETNNGGKSEYEKHMELAEEYMERKLYQKAIEEYKKANSINNTEESWDLMLTAYEKRYRESTKIYSDYLNSAKKASSSYKKNIDYLLTVANLYLKRDEYTAAYKALDKAVEEGIDDEQVNELLMQVKYAYELNWKSYSGYRTCINKYYAVNDRGNWSYIKEDGTDTDFKNLLLAGIVGEDGVRVIRNDIRTELVDTDEVVQGILDFSPEDVGVYAEGLIAVKGTEGYAYYNLLGDKQFGNYDQAGTFTDGEAAVKQGNKWFLVDEKGNKVSDKVYEDIVLQADQSHIKNEMMIIKQEGYYYFVNKKGKKIGKYSDVDIITDDELVAVCVEGQWGYVNLEGEEIIPPVFANAKSFSNGLAAVFDGEYWGFINEEGKLVVDYVFLNADYFNSKGKCMVETGEDVWQLLSLCVEG